MEVESTAPRPITDQVQANLISAGLVQAMAIEISPELQLAWDRYEAVRALAVMRKARDLAWRKLNELDGRIGDQVNDLRARNLLP